MSGYCDIHHLRNFNQNFVVHFKVVLDFDLQPHPGTGSLASEIMMQMPIIQGNYGQEHECILISGYWDINH